MARMRKRGGFYAVIAILLIGWFVYQLASLAKGSPQPKQDATLLLYQVSLFQMELLNGYLSETGRTGATGQLDVLKQAVYSANYTHERLVLAVGERQLTNLKSIGELLQYILRLQIGGDRPLGKDEAAVLQETSAKFRQMFEVYGILFSPGGRVYSSQNDKLKKMDEALYLLLNGSRME